MSYDLPTQRLRFTLLVTAFAMLHLFLEMIDGGVRVHYPLMREDLPPLSNWWGLLILPTIAWLTHTLMEKDASDAGVLGLSVVGMYRLGFALIYGAAMSASFEFGLGQMPLYLLLGLMLGGVFYPLYRIEILLGFVLGMTYTFGAVIPTVVISIVAIISLVLYNSAQFVVRSFKTTGSK